jgi:hypothetical protein
MSDLYQSKKTGNSPRVTLGDPKYVSNKESAEEVNSIDKPTAPKEKVILYRLKGRCFLFKPLLYKYGNN